MELIHHGVKGQKWGVRRYQDYEGHHTELGRKRDRVYTLIRRRTARAGRTMGEVNDIVNSLSKEARKMLNAESEYLSFEQGQFVVKRFLMREGNRPVAFMDLIDRGRTPEGKQNLTVAIAVRGDEQGKGYGYKIANQGAKWIDRNMDIIGDVEWETLDGNKASQILAEKVGFKLDKKNSVDGKTIYRKK